MLCIFNYLHIYYSKSIYYFRAQNFTKNFTFEGISYKIAVYNNLSDFLLYCKTKNCTLFCRGNALLNVIFQKYRKKNEFDFQN